MDATTTLTCQPDRDRYPATQTAVPLVLPAIWAPCAGCRYG